MRTSLCGNIGGGFFGFRWDGSSHGNDNTNYNMEVVMRDDGSTTKHVIGFFENDTQDLGKFFTGQHRNLVNQNINEESVGLIVSSTNFIINVNGTLLPYINESLPFCQITNIDNDKKVYGVISDKEDSNDYRITGEGSFKTTLRKISITNKDYSLILLVKVPFGYVIKTALWKMEITSHQHRCLDMVENKRSNPTD